MPIEVKIKEEVVGGRTKEQWIDYLTKSLYEIMYQRPGSPQIHHDIQELIDRAFFCDDKTPIRIVHVPMAQPVELALKSALEWLEKHIYICGHGYIGTTCAICMRKTE